MKKPATARKVKSAHPEIYWVIGGMVVVLFALVVIPILMRTFNTFDYQGLTFTREKFGEIPVYHYSYYFSDELGQQYQYNLYLRNDPRANKVPIADTIRFNDRKMTYITMNSTALAECSTSLRDVAALAQFLGDNRLPVSAGNVDSALAAEHNIAHVRCDTHPGNVVIAILPGVLTEVTGERDCHRITYASCDELLPALEKFMVQSILDAKG